LSDGKAPKHRGARKNLLLTLDALRKKSEHQYYHFSLKTTVPVYAILGLSLGLGVGLVLYFVGVARSVVAIITWYTFVLGYVIIICL